MNDSPTLFFVQIAAACALVLFAQTMLEAVVNMIPVTVTIGGVAVPLLGIAPIGLLPLVRLIGTFFTGALSLQMGLENTLLFVAGEATESRLKTWSGFAPKDQFAKSPLKEGWLAGMFVMVACQMLAGGAGVIDCLNVFFPNLVDNNVAGSLGNWGYACGAYSLVAYTVMLFGMRWSKDYPAAAKTVPYISLAVVTTVSQLIGDGAVDAAATGASSQRFILLEFLITAIVAAVFVQSGADKLVDWAGNAGWLSGYFADCLLAPLWLPGLLTLTLFENLCGFTAIIGCIQYAQGSVETARATSILSLVLMLASLTVVMIGMLFKKDHDQAGPVIPYVTFGLAAILILAWQN